MGRFLKKLHLPPLVLLHSTTTARAVSNFCQIFLWLFQVVLSFYRRLLSILFIILCRFLFCFLSLFLLLIVVCYNFEKMVGTGDLSIVFEGEGCRLKIENVAPMFNLVVARHGTSPKPRFGAVNNPMEWKIPEEDCRVCDVVKGADGVELMLAYIDSIARETSSIGLFLWCFRHLQCYSDATVAFLLRANGFVFFRVQGEEGGRHCRRSC